MKYIQILMKSYNNVSHNERKAYLNSLWGSPSNKKKGSIMKFCTSIGFKPVMYDICTKIYIYQTCLYMQKTLQEKCPRNK